MENVVIICCEFSVVGFIVYGGEYVFYVWIKIFEGMDFWGFFDYLLNKVNVVGMLGSGFGVVGEGYFCLLVFNSCVNVDEVMVCIKVL